MEQRMGIIRPHRDPPSNTPIVTTFIVARPISTEPRIHIVTDQVSDPKYVRPPLIQIQGSSVFFNHCLRPSMTPVTPTSSNA